ncbi:hypothetical protein M0Q97_08760 [Candidatus Dojkabacteria bacterium]|jgi:hypothetical protein|nr:hypothetical protein [Candidatus Dojkabacteria bacterium]
MKNIINNNEYNTLKNGSKNFNTENWKVYHPNGKHMFTSGERKAQWYLDRNLAIVIGRKKIRLTFNPKGSGFEDYEEFGRNARVAKCVVSGSRDSLQRHHIVPYCYRTHFPEEFKSKNHHDVVLINYELHNVYEQFANNYKNIIANMYGVKTINEFNTKYTTILHKLGKNNLMILNTINTILKNYNNVSKIELLQKLQFISNETEIPFNFIKNLTLIQLYKLYILIKNKYDSEIEAFKINNRFLYDHGYHVVKKLDTEEKILEFVKLWRIHFIETMKPEHMPKGWSIDFRIKSIL